MSEDMSKHGVSKSQIKSVNNRILADHEGHICSYSSWLDDLHVVGKLKTISKFPFYKRHIVIEVIHAFTIYGHRDVAVAQYDLGPSSDFLVMIKNMEFWEDMQSYYANCKTWQSYINDKHQNY